jgi:hypothetical protein
MDGPVSLPQSTTCHGRCSEALADDGPPEGACCSGQNVPGGSFATGRGKLQVQQCPQCPVSDGRPEKGGLVMGQNATSRPYSITSSAVASRVGGTVKPRALAVVRLMTSSKVVGSSTGMSPGFAPRRILSTISAARRKRSVYFGP